MKNKNYLCYLVIFLFTLSYFFFFGINDYLISDDTIYHTSNILVMSKEISFLNLIPGKIMPTLVNNLGYGVNLFYPIFPHLVGSYLVRIFDLFGIGIAGVMKFMHFMVIFLSGVFMYKYIITAFKDRKQALLSAIIYQSMPYLFTDVFMRGALNESFLFIYLPIIFLGLYYLFESSETNKFYFCFVFGYSLLICSHLVLAIYLTILLIPFLLIYYKKLFKKDNILKLIIGSILILLITSNFWGPLLEHNLLKNYYILNLEYVDSMDVEVANVLYYFFPLKFSNVRPSYFLLFFISPVCLFFIVCNYFMIYKKKILKKHYRILGGVALFLLMSIIVASSSSLWKFVPNMLKNIQFTWRLALFVAFGASVLGGYSIKLFNNNFQKKILLIVISFSVISNLWLSSKLEYVDVKKIEFLKDSCCHLQWSYEYLPVVAKRNSLHLYNKRLDLGNMAINNNLEIIENDVPNMKFKISNLDSSINIEFPRIFYLGYKLKDEDNKEIKLYQNDFGLLSAVIDKEGIYYLEYEGTLIDRITKVLSFITLFGFIIYFCFYKFKKRS